MKKKVHGKTVMPFIVGLISILQYISLMYFDRNVSVFIMISTLSVLLAWVFGTHYDQLRHLSERDALTGAYNRRNVLRLFQQLNKMANKQSRKVIVFFIDVDNFKKINDEHGHHIGDLILKKVSEVLRNSFGGSDYIIRWGGDEFLVMSLCEDDSGVELLQTYLYRQLSASFQGLSVKVSLSVGYALYPDESLDFQEVLAVAGKKMYVQKDHCFTSSKLGDEGMRYGITINGSVK